MAYQPNEIGCFYKVELDRPIQHKRHVDRVESVKYCNFKEGYAEVYYTDGTGLYCSSDIAYVKIYDRKNGSHYVQFNGKRYNVGFGVHKEYEDCIFKDNIQKRLYY